MYYTKILNIIKDNSSTHSEKVSEIEVLLQDTANQYYDSLPVCFACPRCGCTSFKFHASYNRNVYVTTIIHCITVIKRFKCDGCHRTFTVLPPFIIRFKRYTIHFIIDIITYLTTLYIERVATVTQLYPGYLYFLKKQYNQWHETGLKVLKLSLPPPCVASFKNAYKNFFKYDFMQNITNF